MQIITQQTWKHLR